MSGCDGQARHVVFLQGMPSPFFTQVGRELERRGCRAIGINLCAGDWLFWSGNHRCNFRGQFSNWPAFFDRLLQEKCVTDVVLLGEQRDYHKAAIAVAQSRGVRVTVTDFGYLRPDWITLERDGMNGNTRFPKDPLEIRRIANLVGEPNLGCCYTDSTFNMSMGDVLYNLSNLLLWWLYPHYVRSDRRPHPLIYLPMMGFMLARRGVRQILGSRAARMPLPPAGKVFVFPLQLEHDFQIVAYSPFKGMEEALTTVVRSFAAHAAPETQLIVKMHPWDPGLKNWGRVVRRCAAQMGVQDRVIYVMDVDLDSLISRSEGVVTINSTSGIRALQLNKPVKALASAIYAVPGLTFQGTLDNFWCNTSPPDPVLVRDFIKALVGTIQIRGVFFREPGLSAAAKVVAQRLFDGSVGRVPG